MDYTQKQQQAAPPAPADIKENTGGGPLASPASGSTYSYSARRVARSRLERVGFWVIVAAAAALLLVFLSVFLGPFVNSAILGFIIGLFVAILTLLNLKQPSAWGNAVLGRQVFPVLNASEKEIGRLAWVNGVLVFGFTFMVEVLASFVGVVFAGIIVFAVLVALGVFYSRVRSVVIKP